MKGELNTIMKIIHIGGGLGNQMANFSTYLGAKLANPEDHFYFETMSYEMVGYQDICCQWNGYELDKVFNINVPNIKDVVSHEEYLDMLKELQETEYWKKGNGLYHITTILKKHRFKCQNANFDIQTEDNGRKSLKFLLKSWMIKQSSNWISYYVRRIIFLLKKNLKRKENSYAYKKRDDYYYPSCSFEIMKSSDLIELIGEELRNAFQFPTITDEKNIAILERIMSCDSVSIHARRSDFLQYNSDCYKYGYFKRAVKFIKSKVEKPIFFIFSEESDWCKEHLDLFGIDDKSDKYYFVDWNSGENSFRDMQLMSLCKHNIITKSSFGWWASFLNSNPEKITCSQISDYVTTHQF